VSYGLKIKKLVHAGALIMVIIGCATNSDAAHSAALKCDKLPGMIEGPFVPTPKVAIEIYMAVANGRGDKLLPENVIKVDDDGDHWSVFQSRANLPPGQVMYGGGTLDMNITKCDGSISAHYSR
jgi:hypothetical protein